jgi:hypothetical protein
VSGSGTNALVFTTTILSGQTNDGVAIALNALNLNGATLQDNVGNNSNNNASSAVSSNANYFWLTPLHRLLRSHLRNRT